jgi:hypothetical protein
MEEINIDDILDKICICQTLTGTIEENCGCKIILDINKKLIIEN